MRSILTFVAIPVLLSGCAFQGTIVEKRSRLRPDSSMIGTEGTNSFVFRGPGGSLIEPNSISSANYWNETGGSYKFLIRDQAGNVRSQLVTPEVFLRYNVGDYFNDMGAPPPPRSAKDRSTKVGAIQRTSVPHQQQVAQKHRTHHRVAKLHRHSKRHNAIARRASDKTRNG